MKKNIDCVESLLDKISFLEDLLRFTSMQKVANFIYYKEDEFTKMKHREIAKILRIAPETLSRQMKILIKEEIITKKTHLSFEVVDRAKLKEFI